MTIEIYNRIIGYLASLIRETEWEGHLYAVGGCCRDIVMQRVPNDIDLAVTLPRGGVRFALWLYDKGLLADKPTLFHKYDTSMFTLREFPDSQIECVQTRKCKYTSGNRRHSQRAFGSLKQDAHLRDLTINTLYYDISEKKMIDGSGYAINDIKHRILRTPANPEVIFHDDPIRILRTIRFSAQLGWKINPHTYAAMKKFVRRLKEVKYPRILNELTKISAMPQHAMADQMMARLNIPQTIDKVKEDYLLKLAGKRFGKSVGGGNPE